MPDDKNPQQNNVALSTPTKESSISMEEKKDNNLFESTALSGCGGNAFNADISNIDTTLQADSHEHLTLDASRFDSINSDMQEVKHVESKRSKRIYFPADGSQGASAKNSELENTPKVLLEAKVSTTVPTSTINIVEGDSTSQVSIPHIDDRTCEKEDSIKGFIDRVLAYKPHHERSEKEEEKTLCTTQEKYINQRLKVKEGELSTIEEKSREGFSTSQAFSTSITKDTSSLSERSEKAKKASSFHIDDRTFEKEDSTNTTQEEFLNQSSDARINNRTFEIDKEDSTDQIPAAHKGAYTEQGNKHEEYVKYIGQRLEVNYLSTIEEQSIEDSTSQISATNITKDTSQLSERSEEEKEESKASTFHIDDRTFEKEDSISTIPEKLIKGSIDQVSTTNNTKDQSKLSERFGSAQHMTKGSDNEDTDKNIQLFNRGNTMLSLSGIELYPDNFDKGTAINNGSCFFDSFKQGLKQQKGKEVSVEQLREDCKKFASNNPPEWFETAIAASYDNNEQPRSESIELYKKNIMKSDRWGDPGVEGRILCGTYKVKLHVIEDLSYYKILQRQVCTQARMFSAVIQSAIMNSGSNRQLAQNLQNITAEEAQQLLMDMVGYDGLHCQEQLYTSSGEEHLNNLNYHDNDIIHMMNTGKAHFVPILKQNQQSQRSEELEETLEQVRGGESQDNLSWSLSSAIDQGSTPRIDNKTFELEKEVSISQASAAHITKDTSKLSNDSKKHLTEGANNKDTNKTIEQFNNNGGNTMLSLNEIKKKNYLLLAEVPSTEALLKRGNSGYRDRLLSEIFNSAMLSKDARYNDEKKGNSNSAKMNTSDERMDTSLNDSLDERMDTSLNDSGSAEEECDGIREGYGLYREGYDFLVNLGDPIKALDKFRQSGEKQVLYSHYAFALVTFKELIREERSGTLEQNKHRYDPIKAIEYLMTIKEQKEEKIRPACYFLLGVVQSYLGDMIFRHYNKNVSDITKQTDTQFFFNKFLKNQDKSQNQLCGFFEGKHLKYMVQCSQYEIFAELLSRKGAISQKEEQEKEGLLDKLKKSTFAQAHYRYAVYLLESKSLWVKDYNKGVESIIKHLNLAIKNSSQEECKDAEFLLYSLPLKKETSKYFFKHKNGFLAKEYLDKLENYAKCYQDKEAAALVAKEYTRGICTPQKGFTIIKMCDVSKAREVLSNAGATNKLKELDVHRECYNTAMKKSSMNEGDHYEEFQKKHPLVSITQFREYENFKKTKDGCSDISYKEYEDFSQNFKSLSSYTQYQEMKAKEISAISGIGNPLNASTPPSNKSTSGSTPNSSGIGSMGVGELNLGEQEASPSSTVHNPSASIPAQTSYGRNQEPHWGK